MHEIVVMDNGMQFTYKKFRGFLASYKFKHHFTSIDHPGQLSIKEANKVTLQGLKKMLDDRTDELESMLWSY